MNDYVLCISASIWGLCKPFAGQNHPFCCFNVFFCLFPSQTGIKTIKGQKKERKHRIFIVEMMKALKLIDY